MIFKKIIRGIPDRKNSIFLLLVGMVLLFWGCSQEKTDGEAISTVITKVGTNPVSIKIGEIFSRPDHYTGTLVKLEGKIVWECPDGCELHLQDKTGVIFVALYPSGIFIPQKLGSTATVEGKVVRGRGRFMIVGKKIEIK